MTGASARSWRAGWLVVAAAAVVLAALGGTEAGAFPNWSSTQAYMCRPTATPPVIDGDLSDPCWSQAEVAVGFHPRGADRTQWADLPTSLRLCYDSEALYLAYECPEPNLGGITAVPHPRDFDVYTEDMVGLLLDVGHKRGGHYDMELAVSAAGTQYDFAWGLQEAWNGDWTAAPRLYPAENKWVCEMRMPFTDTRQAPKKGDIWGMQAMRWRYAGGPETISIWSAVPTAWGINFWESSTFGHLLFEAGDKILSDYVKALSDKLLPQRQEASRVAAFTSDPAANRAAVEKIFSRLTALEQTAAKGLALTGDEWADAFAEADAIAADFENVYWPMKIEELFRE
jgi:hypothetical protein